MMPSKPNREVDDGSGNHVITPFAETTSDIVPQLKLDKRPWGLWIVSFLLICTVVGGICYFSLNYINDPYRTLEPFPIDKYFADYQSLAGIKFKGDFTVAADLGWKDGIGRLMVFTVQNDSRPIPVLVPPKLSAIFFTKGQTYKISLEIGEGGLIHADSCEKE